MTKKIYPKSCEEQVNKVTQIHKNSGNNIIIEIKTRNGELFCSKVTTLVNIKFFHSNIPNYSACFV